ncbi:MAG: glycosyltransferase [Campylobacteraceae bacterium]|jgi:glycosyltransferase involved in cell wall biosynthesis|nr:glycosyltransferase [Campylobacteraceae bacterium]
MADNKKIKNKKEQFVKQPLISVIVPIYNVEIYLKKCLDSIISQTYKNLEIILIDDGSPDNCGKICDEYALKDKRIKVIHKKNGGLSDARNAGLDAAKGEYIAFVDSDDYITENIYEELVGIAQKETADIVMHTFYIIDNKGVKISQIEGADSLSIDEIRYLILMDKYSNCACDKLYKAELFKDLKFFVGAYSEDLFIMPTLFFRAKKAVLINKPYYYYNCTNQNSIMSTFSAKRKYGFFNGWAEHERIAALFCKKALEWSEFRAIRNAVSSLVVNMQKPDLTQKEIEHCKNYLQMKRKNGVIADIGLKYKILWWSLDNCPLICRLYGKISFSLNKFKKRIKNSGN